MRSIDRQLCATLRRMAVQSTQTIQDIDLSTDKVDCERGVVDEVSRLGPSTRWSRLRLLKLIGLLGLSLLVQQFWSIQFRGFKGEIAVDLVDVCPQVDALTPPRYEALLESLDQEFGSREFKFKAYESLGGAVRIPTECYDDLGPPTEDPRWDIHTKFHEYLESRFPKVHINLKRTRLNTHALLYEWKGTENSKPLVLAAHIDVVPVNPDTYGDWINPPYSGHYDGTWIWGRGSCDDKPGVIGSLTAVETLLEREFVPSRTVLLAFGSDEERSGSTGAAEIGKQLLETYGPDSVALLVDEGGEWVERNGTVFSMPSISEKGMVNVRMDVLTPGGHSSRPPKHTGIGILADLITELEAHPDEPGLVRGMPYYQHLECRAKYEPDFPPSLKQILWQSRTSDDKLRELRRRLIDFDPEFSVLSGTTQAFDLIGGGVKVNALPEAVWTVANYRIVDHSSPTEVEDHLTGIVLPVAAKHNLSLEAFGKLEGPQGPSLGTIRLSETFASALAPSPVTPTKDSGPYDLLSGTIRSTFQTHLRTDGLSNHAVVAPACGHGNTDTRHYWNLTKHIFRYGHRSPEDTYNGIHTVNEAIRAEAFLEQIRFLTRLILNADQSDLLD